MEAEKIVLPNGNTASLAATHTLTATDNTQVKVVPIAALRVVVFLIGGAGDKKRFLGSGPNHNILPLLSALQSQVSNNIPVEKNENFSIEYIGYYEAYGDDRIQENVISKIKNKRTLIYIVGHSLGGWNGAHLSRYLSEKGYQVKLLITLDPVGESTVLELSSKIYHATPAPSAKRWINVVAKPSSSNFTDFVAWAGEKWVITSGPDINASVDTNHAEAVTLMTSRLGGASSAYQLLLQDIVGELTK